MHGAHVARCTRVCRRPPTQTCQNSPALGTHPACGAIGSTQRSRQCLDTGQERGVPKVADEECRFQQPPVGSPVPAVRAQVLTFAVRPEHGT
eukprot:5594886-Prymnesium_polylepis.2